MSIKTINDLESFRKEVGQAPKSFIQFKAEWCRPCKAMEPIVEEISNEKKDIVFYAVDIEGDGIDQVLQEYGVRSVPTFAYVENGAIKTTTGPMRKGNLSEFIGD